MSGRRGIPLSAMLIPRLNAGRGGPFRLGSGQVPGRLPLGDYGEKVFYEVAPGAIQQPPHSNIEAAPSVGAGMAALIVGPQQQVDFRWVREVPMETWEAYAYLVGTIQPLRIDQPLRRDRRVVVIKNTSTLNPLWIGHGQGLTVNNGFYLGPGDSFSLPLKELAQIWAIADPLFGNVITSVVQFA